MVLVHGFGTAITSLVRPQKKEVGGFYAFRKHVNANTCAVFDWSTDHALNWWQTHPWSFLSIYIQDRKNAEAPDTLKRLADFLQREQPDTILCHSLGAQLLMNLSQMASLPSSVRHIVFVQADINSGKLDFSAEVMEKIKTSKVTLTNYYCLWDPTLLLGSIYHFQFRAGLVGHRDQMVKNVHFPLTRLPNLHVSTICNDKFVEELFPKS